MEEIPNQRRTGRDSTERTGAGAGPKEWRKRRRERCEDPTQIQTTQIQTTNQTTKPNQSNYPQRVNQLRQPKQGEPIKPE